MMTTMTRTISSGPAECKAEPPVALKTSSLLGTTTVFLPLQLALGADYRPSGGPSAQAFDVEGGPPTFPTRLSNPLHSLRGSHRPINAQECASTLIRCIAVAVDRSRVRTDSAAEVRGDARAACETAYTGAVRSIHH
jgi:hypothetical protein